MTLPFLQEKEQNSKLLYLQKLSLYSGAKSKNNLCDIINLQRSVYDYPFAEIRTTLF